VSQQKSFLFDVNKCTGCAACQIACSIENRVEAGIDWRRVHTFNPRHVPGVPSFHHSLACNHCVDPPCMKHCPALAYSKDPDTGAVTIDADKCIGCKYCSWACPYDAPRFNAGAGTMEKCTFCSHRLDEGLEPACVSLCPTGALGFGEYDPAGETVVPGFTQSEIGPAIKFVTQRRWAVASAGPSVVTACVHPPDPAVVAATAAPGRIDLRSEWTLMVFTFLGALLSGWYAAALLAPAQSIFAPVGPPHPLIFAVAGAAGLALAASHLGRWNRAWRAVLNWRHSWLSREVLLFPAFLALATITLADGSAGGIFNWIVAALGFAALFAMDSVYHVTRAPGLWLHSAQVFLTGLLMAGLFSSNSMVFGVAVVVKASLYLWRKYNFFRAFREARPWFTRVRVLAGLAAPLALWWNGDPRWFPVIVALILAGELIDRAEFYLELDAPSPARQMDADLADLFQQKGLS